MKFSGSSLVAERETEAVAAAVAAAALKNSISGRRCVEGVRRCSAPDLEE